VLKVFGDDQVWKSTLVRNEIVGRLARRYAGETSEAGFAGCALLLEHASSSNAGALNAVLAGLDEGLAGQTLEKTPPALVPWLATHAPGQDVKLIRVGLRLGMEPAQAAAWKAIDDPKIPEPDRAAIIELLGETRRKEFLPDFLKIAESQNSETLRLAALAALQHLSEPQIATRLLELYPGFPAALRQRTIQLLTSRSPWAVQLVSAVEQGAMPSKDISLEEARHITAHDDPSLSRRVEKIWGRIQAGASTEKQNRINELRLVLKPSGAAGRVVKGQTAEGKKIFQQACAVCHKLYGEGNTIGPDLTALDRKDTDNLLVNIVNPSAYIRNEYVSFETRTRDGQVVTGLMAESGANSITLLDGSNQRHTLARDEIVALNESQVSLMPEGLLDALQPQQVIDLFSYLQMDPVRP
jgi:putative heme-binding domain-containing protein